MRQEIIEAYKLLKRLPGENVIKNNVLKGIRFTLNHDLYAMAHRRRIGELGSHSLPNCLIRSL